MEIIIYRNDLTLESAWHIISPHKCCLVLPPPFPPSSYSNEDTQRNHVAFKRMYMSRPHTQRFLYSWSLESGPDLCIFKKCHTWLWCTQNLEPQVKWLRMELWGFPGGAVVKNPPANGHRFELWSGKITHAAEQLSPCTTTTEPAL